MTRLKTLHLTRKWLKLHFWKAMKPAVLFTTWCVCVSVVLWGGHRRDKRIKIRQCCSWWQVGAPDRFIANWHCTLQTSSSSVFLYTHSFTFHPSSAAHLLYDMYFCFFLLVVTLCCLGLVIVLHKLLHYLLFSRSEQLSLRWLSTYSDILAHGPWSNVKTRYIWTSYFKCFFFWELMPPKWYAATSTIPNNWQIYKVKLFRQFCSCIFHRKML